MGDSDAGSNELKPNTVSDEEESDTSSRGQETDTSSDTEESDGTSDEEDSNADSDENGTHCVFLKVWHVNTEEDIGPLRLQGDMQPFQFSPNSKLLALITYTGTAVVLRPDTTGPREKNRLARCEGVTGGALYHHYCRPETQGFSTPYRIEFSPDSSIITIMSSFTGKYAVWETRTFKCIRYQKMNRFFRAVFRPSSVPDESASAAVTEDTLIMVAGAFSEEIRPSEVGDYGPRWKKNRQLEIRWLDSGVVICKLDCQGHVEYTQFSPNHKILASICKGGTIRTWRVETGECLTLFESGQNPRDISLSPDFTLLGSTGTTRTIRVWANDGGETNKISRKMPDPIESVVLSLDRTLAASSSCNGIVRVWDIDTYDCIHEFDDGFQNQSFNDHGNLELFQFSKDGKYLFASRTTSVYQPDVVHDDTSPFLDGHFRIWDVKTGQLINSYQTKIHFTYPIVDFRGSAVSATPDDHWIDSIRDRNVAIIAVDTFSIVRNLVLKGPVYDAMVSPDSRFLIVLSSETSEISSHARGEHESQGLLLSKFSIAQIDHIFSIRFTSRPREILAVSSDARFLVLQTFDGFQRGALAVLTSTGELL
ncbi:WD40 repeat [Fusarium oxysporum f. sp. vasinfectum]|uniref:Uncharacterized protein n=1 Tax=Fusarium oxysporum f. sp. vasinfectum 25433 TaxID=1089449 RepID=X0LGC4_FUSOX|nr:hypothetical protein FOTG_11908 [Fusarium oxysporum f. sp. vasinfectum 25433]KAK2676587.1 WD40 repeat [Fusarium oxysporum f. sp. vasinfectum]